jgi:4-hydroxy-tetrahydrodipicolinate reductase
MGRMVERAAEAAGHAIHARIDAGDELALAAGADAAIEFTEPGAAVRNILSLAELGVPVVCGTTGWLAELGAVTAEVERRRGALVWSANFSIGVNLFARIVESAAGLFASQPAYEAWAWEIHHAAKKDAPSGTLKQLVAAMRAAGYARRIDESSSRAGAVPGTHEIGFDAPEDTITLRHTARNREGFARGAVRAAEWIRGKEGVYEFRQILFE